jgi:sugar O-acyltransferase (sialic acid O-acetyltransferase NeuD family)
MSAAVVVLGGGGHAKVLVEILLAAGIPVRMIAEADPARRSGSLFGVPTSASDEDVLACGTAEIQLVNGVGSVNRATQVRRMEVYQRFAKAGFAFASVVHHSAIVGRDVQLGDGVQLLAGAVVQPASSLGGNALINTRASVDHDCVIGEHVHICPGAVLCGGVSVGEGALIGAGAVIGPGRRIGEGAVIGAGQVVMSDVASHTTLRAAQP